MSCSIMRVATAGSISFGVGRKNNERVETRMLDIKVWNRSLISTAIRNGTEPARHGRFGQPLRGPVRGRGRRHRLDRRPLRLARLRAQDRHGLHKTRSSLFGSRSTASRCQVHQEWPDKVSLCHVCRPRSGSGEVRCIFGGMSTDSVHNHHNYCWLEMHNGRSKWVVRKGATPGVPWPAWVRRRLNGRQRGRPFTGSRASCRRPACIRPFTAPAASCRARKRVASGGRACERTEGRRHDDWQGLARRGRRFVILRVEAPQAYEGAVTPTKKCGTLFEALLRFVVMACPLGVDPDKD